MLYNLYSCLDKIGSRYIAEVFNIVLNYILIPFIAAESDCAQFKTGCITPPQSNKSTLVRFNRMCKIITLTLLF